MNVTITTPKCRIGHFTTTENFWANDLGYLPTLCQRLVYYYISDGSLETIGSARIPARGHWIGYSESLRAMRINKTTYEMVRILAHIHARGRGMTTVAEIADSLQLSLPTASKHAYYLVSRGLLIGVRGPRGGVRLARPGSEMRLGELFRQLERSRLEKEQPRERHHLPDDPQTSEIINSAFSAFFQVLDQHSLADLHEFRGTQTSDAGDRPVPGIAAPW